MQPPDKNTPAVKELPFPASHLHDFPISELTPPQLALYSLLLLPEGTRSTPGPRYWALPFCFCLFSLLGVNTQHPPLKGEACLSFSYVHGQLTPSRVAWYRSLVVEELLTSCIQEAGRGLCPGHAPGNHLFRPSTKSAVSALSQSPSKPQRLPCHSDPDRDRLLQLGVKRTGLSLDADAQQGLMAGGREEALPASQPLPRVPHKNTSSSAVLTTQQSHSSCELDLFSLLSRSPDAYSFQFLAPWHLQI